MDANRIKLCLVKDISYRVTDREAEMNKGLSNLRDRMQALAGNLCWLEVDPDRKSVV